jgi:hypothetical protein
LVAVSRSSVPVIAAVIPLFGVKLPATIVVPLGTATAFTGCQAVCAVRNELATVIVNVPEPAAVTKVKLEALKLPFNIISLTVIFPFAGIDNCPALLLKLKFPPVTEPVAFQGPCRHAAVVGQANTTVQLLIAAPVLLLTRIDNCVTISPQL